MHEYKGYAFDETLAQNSKGQWRELAFSTKDTQIPMDVEIGTANGWFFAHQAEKAPDRLILGIELKFKPLILAIRRVLAKNLSNARICRFHAAYLDLLFSDGEINNTYIHHPDPWTKRRKQKHRLMSHEFLDILYNKQRNNSFLDFKTDSRDYFFWAVEEIKKSKYKMIRYAENLHQSEWVSENFITQFENIFINQGLPIYYMRVEKSEA
jgi:tRNA (guanine-N7-)-methyltransferase